MKSRDASEDKPAKSQSPKLTAAMAFGFAAGALLAKKPGAAIAAVTTGLLTCLSLGRRRDDEMDEPEETKESAMLVPLAEEPLAADVPPTPNAVEPLPALIEDEKNEHSAEPADQPLPISLPEITPVEGTQTPPDDLSPPADVAHHLHDEWIREIEAMIARK